MAINSDPVRVATVAEEDDLLDMLREFSEENGLRDSFGRPLPFSDHRARMTLRHVLAPIQPTRAVDTAGGIVGVIGPQGRIEASIGLGIQFPWYSETAHLTEVWNYVRPKWRRGPHVRALLAFAREMSDAVKMSTVFGVICADRSAAKMRFYEREIGMKPFGAYYLYNREYMVGA